MRIPLQSVLTALMLPPVALVLVGLVGGVLAWRGWRPGAAIAVLAAGSQLLLATPLAAGLLVASLEREVPSTVPAQAETPVAIVVLGAEVARGRGTLEVGPMTLERLRAGAALHRRTGLPLLVTGGTLEQGRTPIAELMAQSLSADFGIAARWVEDRARDTRENASLSAAMLRDAGVRSAYVVTHGWHMPRTRDAFDRQKFTVVAAPVRIGRVPEGIASDWVPRADHLAQSWLVLREWAGRFAYAVRD